MLKIEDEQDLKLEKSKKERKLNYELPPQCIPLMHQAAGHFFGSGKRGQWFA